MIKRNARKLYTYLQRHREPYKTRWLTQYILRADERQTAGTIQIDDWLVDYLDGQSLGAMWNFQFLEKYNDFYTPKPNPTILDCGANIGVSVLRYKALYPKAHVIAFEPDPTIYKVLAKNVQQNQLADVQTIQAAVWTEQTELQFYSYRNNNSQSGHLNYDSSDNLVARDLINVPTISLADYLDEPVDLLKLDIEGAERDVLRTCAPKLGNVQQIMLEVHYHVHDPDFLIDILQILKDAQFKVAIYQKYNYPNTASPFGSSTQFVADQFPLIWAWREYI